jgi:hypothetical protein
LDEVRDTKLKSFYRVVRPVVKEWFCAAEDVCGVLLHLGQTDSQAMSTTALKAGLIGA